MFDGEKAMAAYTAFPCW